jgi:tetratricopeptide (TPR) repeat protein
MRRTLLPLLAAAAVVIAAPAVARRLAPSRAVAATVAPAPPMSAARAAELRDLDIAFWTRRAGEDPLGAEDRVHAAALLLARARETGSHDDVLRADSLAREAVRLRPERNERGLAVLAAALVAQHRFREAHAVAARLDSLAPDTPLYRATRGEIALELGRYDEARRAFDGVLAAGGAIEPGVGARVARYEELTGNAARARTRLAAAARAATSRANVPAEQRAWYLLRLADHDLRHGRLATADSLLAVARQSSPDDYRLLGARARLAWMRGDWADAVAWGERAIATTLDPATLAILSDAHLASGDSARAADYAEAMGAAVTAQGGPLHRGWSLFLLDRGRDLRGVLARARAERRERRDVHGADVEAWALHALGRDAEAWPLAEEALAQGTEDATIEYHAGVIADATGRADRARAHLSRALTINPHFHPRQAADARERLARLARPPVEPTLAPVVVSASPARPAATEDPR